MLQSIKFLEVTSNATKMSLKQNAHDVKWFYTLKERNVYYVLLSPLFKKPNSSF